MSQRKSVEVEHVLVEAYNVVLHDWTRALCRLGCSKHLTPTVLRLWLTFLQHKRGALLSWPPPQPHLYKDLKKKQNARMQNLEKSLTKSSHPNDHSLLRSRLPPATRRKPQEATPAVLPLKTSSAWSSGGWCWRSRSGCATRISPPRGKRRQQVSKQSRRSTRLRGRQPQVSLVHHEDLSSVEDITTTSGSDQEYQPHRPKGPYNIPWRTSQEGRKRPTTSLLIGDSRGAQREEERQDRGKEAQGERSNKHGAKFNDSHGNKTKLWQYTTNTLEQHKAHKGGSAAHTANHHHTAFPWVERGGGGKGTKLKSRGRRGTRGKKGGAVNPHPKARVLSRPERREKHLWSLPYMLNLLLSLLYLAVLLAQEEVLLMDILSWCRNGQIPFLSAPLTVNCVLRSYVPHCPLFLKVPRIPSSRTLRQMACQLSLLLSLQSVPLPPEGTVIKRLVSVLRLPVEAQHMAQEVVALKRLAHHYQEFEQEALVRGEVPGVECQAAAALVVTLKLCCGLNDLSEHHLSVVATRVNTALGHSADSPVTPAHSTLPLPLFSFDEWMSYILRVVWVSRQVSPLCEVAAMPSATMQPTPAKTRLLSQLSRIITFCSSNPTVSLPDVENYPTVKRILELQDLSLQSLCENHKRAFGPPGDPLLGTLEKYLVQHSNSTEDQQAASAGLQQKAQDLLEMTFTHNQLFWTQHLTTIQQQLQAHDSHIILKPMKYPHSLCPRDHSSKTAASCLLPREPQSYRKARVSAWGVGSGNRHHGSYAYSSDTSPPQGYAYSQLSTWMKRRYSSSVDSSSEHQAEGCKLKPRSCPSEALRTSGIQRSRKNDVFVYSNSSSSEERNVSTAKDSIQHDCCEGTFDTHKAINKHKFEDAKDAGYRDERKYKSMDIKHSKYEDASSSKNTNAEKYPSFEAAESSGEITSVNVDSTSTGDSNDSSILAHESLDKLLRDSTSTTALKNTMLVPVPAYRVWQVPDTAKVRRKEVWASLPRDFKWVVGVFSVLCWVSRQELVQEVRVLEELVRAYSSLLFLFPGYKNKEGDVSDSS